MLYLFIIFKDDAERFHMKDKKQLIILIAQITALVLLVVIMIIFGSNIRSITTDDLIDFAPKNRFLAAMTMLLYYVVKSFIVIIPVLVVQLAAGILFPLPLALAINLLGLIITLSISYFLGRFTGKTYVDKLIAKYPKSAILHTLPSKNELVFSLIIHILCIFPMNIIGMVIGSLNVKYRNYMLGGFLGSMVRVISVTIMGTSVTDPTSPTFIISTAATILISVATVLIYKIYSKKKAAKEAAQSADESAEPCAELPDETPADNISETAENPETEN